MFLPVANSADVLETLAMPPVKTAAEYASKVSILVVRPDNQSALPNALMKKTLAFSIAPTSDRWFGANVERCEPGNFGSASRFHSRLTRCRGDCGDCRSLFL